MVLYLLEVHELGHWWLYGQTDCPHEYFQCATWCSFKYSSVATHLTLETGAWDPGTMWYAMTPGLQQHDRKIWGQMHYITPAAVFSCCQLLHVYTLFKPCVQHPNHPISALL
jgi:hypothetical protein